MSNKPLYHAGQQVCRKASLFDVETITHISTDKRGLYWYYTTTADGVRRVIGLAEHEIIAAQ